MTLAGLTSKFMMIDVYDTVHKNYQMVGIQCQSLDVEPISYSTKFKSILMKISKKKIFGQKTICQWSNSGPGAEKRRAEWPNGHLPENRSYPELPQDMGDLRSHWVGSV